ncbi:hypothetical protein Tco_1239314, partial [Tanacetum coccineum]
CVCLDNEEGALSLKGRGRGKGVKEKQSLVIEDPGIVCDHVVGATGFVYVPSSVVPTTMENVVMSLDVDELVVASGNNKGTEDRKL